MKPWEQYQATPEEDVKPWELFQAEASKPWEQFAEEEKKQKSLKELVLGPAGVSGANVWSGIGHTLGLVSDEDYKQSLEQAKVAQQEHPVQSMIGQAGAMIVPTIAAGAAAPAVPLAAPMLAAGTLGAVLGGHEYARLGPAGENASPTARLQATDLASDVGMMGVAAPAAVGKTLAQRVATGAGINTLIGGGQRAIEHDIIHADRPDLAPGVFDPMAMGADLLIGGGTGAAVHLGAPKGTTPEPKPRVDPAVEQVGPPAPEHLAIAERHTAILEGQRNSEQAKIASLEKDLQEKQFDTPEAAHEAKTKIIEEIAAREENIKQLDKSIQNMKAYISGNTATPAVFHSNRAEIPSGPPPRPEGEWVNTKAMEETGTQTPDPATAAMFDNGTSPYEQAPEQAARPIEQTQPLEAAKEAGTTEGINHAERTQPEASNQGAEVLPAQESPEAIATKEANWDEDPFAGKPAEEVTAVPKEQMAASEFDDLTRVPSKELEDRISSLDMGTPEGRAQFESIATELASRMPAAEKRPVISGGSEKIRAIVKDWLEKLGLSKEEIHIELDSTSPHFEDNMGGFSHVTEGGVGVAEVRSAKAFKEAVEKSPKLQETLGKMTPEEYSHFKEAWTAAHELGHLLFTKLVQNRLYSDSLGLKKLLADFDKYAQKQGVERMRAEGNLWSKPKSSADYYTDFPEYFAQRVARELMMGKSSMSGPVREFVSNIRGFWHDAIKSLGLQKYFQKNFVDDFIVDIIRQNKEALAKTGQTLFELKAIEEGNTVSWYEAHMWQFSPEAKLFPKERNPLNKIQGARDLETIKVAMGTIADVKDVVAEQQRLPDIAPEATKSSWGIVNAIKTHWRKGNMHFENVLFGLQQKQQFYRDSPAVKWSSDVIRNAINKTIERHNTLLNGSPTYADFAGRVKSGWIPVSRIITGDSVTAIAKKASNEDFKAVHDLLEQNYGKKDYGNTLAEDGAHLTPRQKELYTALTKMYTRMYNMAAASAKALGKKNIIPAVKGWYPAVRSRLPYSVNLYLKGANAISGYTKVLDETSSLAQFSDIVHREEFRTKAEADAWVAKWNALPPERRGGMHTGEGVVDNHAAKVDDPQFRADFIEAMNNMIEAIKNDPKGDLNSLQEKLQQQADWFIARGGTLGSHHQFRTNISGYKGTELFKTREDLGQSFRDATFSSVDDYTRTMQKMEIEEKLNLITEDQGLKDSHPNVVETVKSMRDYALSKEKPKFEMKSLQAAIDAMHTTLYRDLNKSSVGKSIIKVAGMKEYPKNSVVQAALGKTGHVFYLFALMGRPAFWASQGAQSMWAARTMVKDGVGPIDAMVASGKAMANFITQPKDFMEALYYVSQNRDTFHPSFISELNQFHILDFLQEGGKGKLVLDLLTGEKQSTMADTFSRLTTFSLMFEHFKQKGFKGEELYNRAANSTDENMVRYGIQDKPPIFKNLGVVGDLISPLTQFAQASLGNMLADAKAIAAAPGGKAKLRASLPFMTTAFITTLMTGTIGSIFIGEMELMRRGLNYLLDSAGMDYQIPSLIDLALAGDNDFSHRVMSHGLMSAATMAVSEDGFDLSSGNRFNDIFLSILAGEKAWYEMAPVLSFTGGLVHDTTVVAANKLGLMDSTDADLRNAKLGITPGWYKAITDMNLPGDQSSLKRSMVPDKQGNATVPQTKSEIIAQFLGTSTIKTHATKFRLRRIDEEFKRMSKKSASLKEKLFDAALAQDDAKVEEYITKLATKFSVTGDQLKEYFKSEAGRRFIDAETRLAMGAKSTQGAVKFGQYMDTYQPDTFNIGEEQQ